jgi:hypothetical protein
MAVTAATAVPVLLAAPEDLAVTAPPTTAAAEATANPLFA